MTKRKVLIYTDSRGQHVPRGQSHDVFGTRLAARDDLDVDLFLCPMKWTTTLDFLAQLEETPADTYDHIILQTGIVDWSPRPQKSAIADLYNNQAPLNLTNSRLNTRDYSAKVVNNKKAMFDRIFGADRMEKHLIKAFDVEFEGQPTINMYSAAMARDFLVPELAKIGNMVFINSNHFVAGWKGDHARGRPDNIEPVTAELSAIFRDGIGRDRTIDLLAWNDDLVKKYTCDNIHLTTAGSDLIYDDLCARLELDKPKAIALGAIAKADGGAKAATAVKAGLISVIVPVYNVEQYLQECLESLADQDDTNFEVVIVIDGSTDKSAQIAEDFCADKPNFRIHYQANKGLGGARNTGIDLAAGEFMTFIDSDDTVAPEHLSGLRKAQAAGNLNVVSARFQTVTESGSFIAFQEDPETPARFGSLELGMKIAGAFSSSISCSRLYKTDFLRGTGIRFPEKLPHEDLFFTYKVMLQAGPHAYADGHTYHWRQRNGSLSRSAGQGHADTVFALLDNSRAFLDSINADKFVRALVTKRDITSLRNISSRMRLRAADSPTYLYLLEKIKARRTEIEGCINTVETILGKDCVQEELYTLMANLDSYIDETKGKQKSTPAAPAAPAVAAPAIASEDLIFPHPSLSLANAAAAEVGKVKPADTERLRKFYNAYKGKRCFIIGNGPSLNKQDLSLLENEYTFGVNSFYYKTRETGFKPTFFVVEDTMVMKENAEEIRNYDVPFKFFPTLYRDIQPEAENTYFFEMNQGFYTKSSPNYCVPRFSTDASKVLYCGQSVTYINLQLAFFMGFTEVYLIGMDFNYVIPPEHQRSGNHILSTTDDPNHFHKDYFGKGKTWKDPKLDRVAMNYRQAKLTFESVGRKIYNATVGGQLDIFERANPYVVLGVPNHPMAAEAASYMEKKEVSMPAVSQPAKPAPVMAPSRIETSSAVEAGPFVPPLVGPAPLPPEKQSALEQFLSKRPLKVVAPATLVSSIALATVPAVAEGLGDWKYAFWGAAGLLGLVTFRVATRAWARIEARRLVQIEAVAAHHRLNATMAAIDKTSLDRLRRTENSVTRSQEKALAAAKDDLTRQLNKVKDVITTRTAKPEDIAAVRQNLDEQLGHLKNVITVRTAKVEDIEGLRNATAAQLKALEAILAKADDLEALRGIAAVQQNALDTAVAQQQALETSFAQQQKDLETSIGQRIEDLEAAADQQIKDLEAATGQQIRDLEAAVANQEALEALRDSFTKQLNKVKDVITTRTAKVENITDLRNEMAEQVAALEEAVSTVSAKTETLDDQRRELHAMIAHLKTVITNRLAKVENVTDLRKEVESHVTALKNLISAVEQKSEGQKRGILEDVGQRFANAEKSWSEQLENVQESASGVLAQSLGGMEQGLDEIKRMVTTQIAELQSAVGKLREKESDIEHKLAAATTAAKAGAEAQAKEQATAISGKVDTVTKTLETELQAAREQIKSASTALSALNDRVAGLTNQIPSHNLRGAQAFNRKLTQDHVATIRQDWSKRLSLTPTPESLFYMAHRVAKLEENGRGRMATTIEESLVRILAAASTSGRSLRVLEIGTLYGLGLAAIYDYCKPRFEEVKITAIDPMDGYYGKQRADVTDEPVTEATFWRNMDLAGVNRDDVTLIKHLSTDDAAIEAASKEKYDMLIIDGDHSYSGVKADYLYYAPFVKRGGIILFDDYNVPAWPEVTQYVDEEAMHQPDIALVGKSWRSAIFKMVRTTEKGAKDAEKPAQQATKRKTAN